MEKNLKLNAIWNTLGITVNSFNSLFFLIIINRVNGVEIAGIFSFAFSIACLLFIVGIYAGRTYQVSDINENLNNYEYLVHKYDVFNSNCIYNCSKVFFREKCYHYITLFI